ncbi:hypothetical protein BH11BAC4_BH11BAC4_20760 [soil metagenome]
MSRFHSYIGSAIKLIDTYIAGKPLSLHIRSFFGADRKFGSRDRRVISSLCYYYFRIGHALKDKTTQEKILAGLFLCENQPNELLQFFRPDLNTNIVLPLAEKVSLAGLNEHDIFPFTDDLGEGIDPQNFRYSFFRQPQLYLRVRPGRKDRVINKLQEAAMPFEWIGDDCITLANNAAVDKVLQLNKEVVVQDLSSQKVLDHIAVEPGFLNSIKKITAWDCCAASGGKSILLFDKLKGGLQLTVSDIRENSLLNLRTRLQQAGININRSFVTDLSASSGMEAAEKFDAIICDVPCSGSGTWGRNPEQLLFFKRKTIDEYVLRQQQIVSNVIPHLQEGGLFFYITCSAFKKENEGLVSFIQQKSPALQLLEMHYLKGYEHAADTMFVAVFSSIVS